MTNAEIQQILKTGKKRVSGDFIVWMKDRVSGTFRATVICSKKIDKRATARNLLKRRVREILRKDIAERLEATDTVVSIRLGAKGKTSRELKESLLDVFSH